MLLLGSGAHDSGTAETVANAGTKVRTELEEDHVSIEGMYDSFDLEAA